MTTLSSSFLWINCCLKQILVIIIWCRKEAKDPLGRRLEGGESQREEGEKECTWSAVDWD
jgi:hypothetical protein